MAACGTVRKPQVTLSSFLPIGLRLLLAVHASHPGGEPGFFSVEETPGRPPKSPAGSSFEKGGGRRVSDGILRCWPNGPG